MNTSFTLNNFGPIKAAEVEFGDMTFIVGPQASGKSIFLQAWKLREDYLSIKNTLNNYSYNTDGDNILKHYFGINNLKMPQIDGASQSNQTEKIFYIPAQRVLCIADGRPKRFMEFDYETPYVVRQFSEYLLQNFAPDAEKMASAIASPSSIYHNGKIEIDSSMGPQKMRLRVGETSLPFVAWSAGQKEYMPLSMANYFISKDQTSKFQYIVIEEPEMGLHPRAIIGFINEVSLLMAKGFKIVISTHSSVFLEFAWVIKTMQDSTEESFKNVISEAGIADSQAIDVLYKSRKNIKTYFFNNGISKDISTLDAWSNDPDVSQMGELTSFNALICDAIAKYKND